MLGSSSRHPKEGGCQVRAVTHVSAVDYSEFVRSYFAAVPTEPLRRLSLVDMFVGEVYEQDETCLLSDSLVREMDEASDAVPGTLFCCNMLVDCSCDDVCD